MDNVLYSKHGFIIFKSKSKFIVYNTKKKFEEGHTHLDSFHQAERIIKLVSAKKLPNNLNTYLLTSLIRISKDEDYIKKIEELIENKRRKEKTYYYNVNSKKAVPM